MRRLFSTFAQGWPGAGLLLIRLVAGIAVVFHGLARLGPGAMFQSTLLGLSAMAAGLLLLAGLWTPISGLLVAVLVLWNAISHRGDTLSNILLGTIGVALALVGPGAWSVDARLFGWKRIDDRDRHR